MIMENAPGDLKKLIVLAGENLKTFPRTNRAVEIYHEYRRIPMILTGSHSGLHGLVLPKGQQPISHQMRTYALGKGVRDEDIVIEDKSLDTVANFYFARLGGLILPGEKDVGLVTDVKHIPRSRWLARKVFGKATEFISQPSESEYSPSFWVQEAAIMAALTWDLGHIPPGDLEKLTGYMKKTHPFHSYLYHPDSNFKPNRSLYGFLVNRARKSKKDFRPNEKQLFE